MLISGLQSCRNFWGIVSPNNLQVQNIVSPVDISSLKT